MRDRTLQPTRCVQRRLATDRGRLVSGALMLSARELPIYELESPVITSLRAQGRLIVQAPTGSGKSTQIPQMLLNHGLLGERGEVVVLQPRRLATRMLAKRVAEEVGTNLGDVVGYQIR